MIKSDPKLTKPVTVPKITLVSSFLYFYHKYVLNIDFKFMTLVTNLLNSTKVVWSMGSLTHY